MVFKNLCGHHKAPLLLPVRMGWARQREVNSFMGSTWRLIKLASSAVQCCVRVILFESNRDQIIRIFVAYGTKYKAICNDVYDRAMVTILVIPCKTYTVSEIAHFYTYTYLFECNLRKNGECAKKTQCTGSTSVTHSKLSKTWVWTDGHFPTSMAAILST